MIRRMLTIFMLAAMATAACGGAGAPTMPAGSEIDDADDLVGALRQAWAEVESAGTISQPFFSVGAEILLVDGSEVQVFEFPDAQARMEQAELVAADGGSIGTTMATWISTPHFFEAGRLIVLYVGEDEELLQLLESHLGSQFAGG